MQDDPIRRIASEADVEEGLRWLAARDPRFAAIRAASAPVGLRRSAGGFEGLAAIVTAQQISTAAAASIWGRLSAAVAPFTPEAFLAAGETRLRAAGLSRQKVATLGTVAEAIGAGLDLDELHAVAPEEAVAALTRHKGVGRWTAEIYLLSCVGHPDIFPAGDLALVCAVRDAFELPERPSERALREMAQAWSPWRGVAARLFWAYYQAGRLRAAPGAKSA